MPRMKSEKKTIVDYLKHGDKRSNIPTEELRDFVAEVEIAPQVVLYPCTHKTNSHSPCLL